MVVIGNDLNPHTNINHINLLHFSIFVVSSLSPFGPYLSSLYDSGYKFIYGGNPLGNSQSIPWRHPWLSMIWLSEDEKIPARILKMKIYLNLFRKGHKLQTYPQTKFSSWNTRKGEHLVSAWVPKKPSRFPCQGASWQASMHWEMVGEGRSVGWGDTGNCSKPKLKIHRFRRTFDIIYLCTYKGPSMISSLGCSPCWKCPYPCPSIRSPESCSRKLVENRSNALWFQWNSPPPKKKKNNSSHILTHRFGENKLPCWCVKLHDSMGPMNGWEKITYNSMDSAWHLGTTWQNWFGMSCDTWST